MLPVHALHDVLVCALFKDADARSIRIVVAAASAVFLVGFVFFAKGRHAVPRHDEIGGQDRRCPRPIVRLGLVPKDVLGSEKGGQRESEHAGCRNAERLTDLFVDRVEKSVSARVCACVFECVCMRGID